ncbi:hypothetical protein QEN19_000344 [Hanseniaspora menglaensis]
MSIRTTLKELIAKEVPSNIKISSSFINKQLVSDDITKDCANNLSEIIQNKEEKTRIFHSPRIVSKGAHFSYCLPEHSVEGIKTPILLNKKAFEKDFNNLDYGDKETVEFLQGTILTKDNCLTDIWQILIQKHNIIPYSQAYAGFQFGQFAGQLGDGRVVNLLDINSQTVQVKGSGLTPYSRFADGKATLKASIREFIISESLNSIGIPSTRALIISTMPSLKAKRGLKWEMTGVVTRFAKSWVRLGNFDLQRWRQDLEGLVKLTDYCIENIVFKRESFIPIENFIEINQKTDNYGVLNGTPYDYFLRNVVISNAISVAKWQAYAFSNGVLNTDNTSLIGISMDFGPFAFADVYNEDWSPNIDDSTKRYSLGNQPKVIWWNLVRFAESLSMLLGSGEKYIKRFKSDPNMVDDEIVQYMTDRTIKVMEFAEKEYDFYYKFHYVKLMVKRLGLSAEKLGLNVHVESLFKDDFKIFDKKLDHLQENLIEPLLFVLKETKVDYNSFFLDFQNVSTVDSINLDGTFKSELYECFNTIHNDLNNFINNQTLERIDALFDPLTVNKECEIYINLEKFANEYQKIWNEINDSEPNLVQEFKKKASTRTNPLFIPRHFQFNEVADSLKSNPSDTKLLEKLYAMSSNPYDAELWEPNLLPDVQIRWTNPDYISQEKNSFLQCGCSS